MSQLNSAPDGSTQYDYPTRELLERLDTLKETTQGELSAADIQRDPESPSLDTYYRRFGWGINEIHEAHQTWKETGEIPETAISTDWHSFHANQNRYTTDELMEHLARVDSQTDRPLQQIDVRRDDDAPTPSTYFDHFTPDARDWETVMSLYQDWSVDTPASSPQPAEGD